MADIKWSAFPDGGAITSGDEVVGLRSGANTRLTANTFDNLNLDTNTISSLDTDGNINIDPNGVGLVVIQGSTGIDAVIDDDSMATASATNVPTAESVVSYIAATAGGAGGSTTQIQYNNAGALAGDTGFTTDGAGTETIVGQLNVDNLRMDGSTLSTTTASDLQLTPLAGQELDINFSSSVIAGVQIRSAEATGNPRLLFYRSNTTSLGGIYSGLNDTFSGTGNNIYLQNPLAGGKIFLRDSTGNALTVSAGNTTLITAGGNISA
jgi:hypothetical protein